MWPRLWLLAALAVLASAVGAEDPDDVLSTTIVPTTTAADTEAQTEAALVALMEASAEQSSSIIKKDGPGDPARPADPESPKAMEEVMVMMESAAAGTLDSARSDAGRKLPLPDDMTMTPMALATPNGTRVNLPLPAIEGDMEDFMEDMQEIDMEMAERSTGKDIPAEEAVVDDAPVDGPLPGNHKAGSLGKGAASSHHNTLGKQARFESDVPPHSKYEMLTANLPVKDYSITGRDKPLNVVFVFPRASNETRKKELEVMLVFPQDKKDKAAAVTATPVQDKEGVRDEADDEEKLQQASEKKETTAKAPIALNRKEPEAYRRDIYKKYANKYASSRPPPVSFFRKDENTK